MTTIQIQDDYFSEQTCNIRINAIELNEEEQSLYRDTHYAIISKNQITKLRRELPNGPRGVNVTKRDPRTDKDIAAEIYFSLWPEMSVIESE